MVEGLNKYNSASHTNVVGTGVPTGEIGISPSGTGISLSLNAALLASGVKIWQKDSSHNWTVYDATPQDEMIIPWISSITALYFQLTVASSQAIRVTKMTSGLLYDVDKTDDDDTPTTLFSDGVSQPIVPIGEGPGGGATITSHAVTDWASGAMQTLSVTAGSTPVVQVIEDVPTPAASSALSYTGANQTFVVPAGVTSLTAKLWGAGGASANGSDGGAGGYVTSTIPVTAGETLNITVGQGGTLGPATTFGGGGGGDTTYPQHGNAGGGLSGIFRGTAMNVSQPSNALVIAGAGGSGGYSAAGGAGGGETAQDGFGSATHSGNGGTQVAGGDGGSATNGTGAAGAQFQGGSLLIWTSPWRRWRRRLVRRWLCWLKWWKPRRRRRWIIIYQCRSKRHRYTLCRIRNHRTTNIRSRLRRRNWSTSNIRTFSREQRLSSYLLFSRRRHQNTQVRI